MISCVGKKDIRKQPVIIFMGKLAFSQLINNSNYPLKKQFLFKQAIFLQY